MGNTGLAGNLSTPEPVYVTALLAATGLPIGALVRENGSGTLVRSADGEDVFGVLACAAEANTNAVVQIGGVVTLTTTGSPGLTQKYQGVACAGSDTIDSGTAGDPLFGTLLYYDSTLGVAQVLLHGTALRPTARSLYDGQGFASWPINALTAGRYLSATGTTIQSLARQGATGSRPGSPFTGQTYFDTTLGCEMTYNGTRWQSQLLPKIAFQNSRATTGTTFNMAFDSYQAAADSTDAESPWVVARASRLVAARFAIRGGTGGKTWTARLRLNNSGADTWTSAGIASTTSWAATDETIDQALAQGDRVTVLVNQGGAAETLRTQIEFLYHWT